MTEDETTSPRDLGSRSWKFVTRTVGRKFAADFAADIAAGLTFHGVLALIPALLVAVSIVSLLGSESEVVGFALTVIRSVSTEQTADAVGGVIDELTDSSIAGFALVFGVALTIWAVARYIAAFGRGMNRVYEVEEGRSPWALKTMQILVAVVLLIAAAFAGVVLVASGPVAKAIGEALSLGDTVLVVWRILRWPILLGIVIACIAFVYDRASNVRHPRFRWLSWGAVVAIVLLAAASALFGLYVTNIADYERVYGSLAGAIIFLLWMWIANLSLMLGVEFDAAVERARELRAGEPAEARARLPLRDRSRIVRKQARRSAEIQEARGLRRRP
ncbi:YihY/virulence factor BrkB family protein [Microbacterium sp. 179-I 3D4 NHS]|uniref:YihY/virulence factor BrkB family protein n=1 Tax=Microbacterium sp. 179-I 3D4 NHS TaxID=3142381 RepID=UPI00399F0100